MNKEEREICNSIGEFYLKKNQKGESPTREEGQSAADEITRLGITSIRLNKNITIPTFQQKITELVYGADKVQLKKDEIEITLARPGLLIGKRGENIEKLNTFLQEKNNISHIRIVEDTEGLLEALLFPCWNTCWDDF